MNLKVAILATDLPVISIRKTTAFEWNGGLLLPLRLPPAERDYRGLRDGLCDI